RSYIAVSVRNIVRKLRLCLHLNTACQQSKNHRRRNPSRPSCPYSFSSNESISIIRPYSLSSDECISAIRPYSLINRLKIRE
ncbi:MAG: hypothetical protein LBR18_03400, partial [Tannerella sp.]|nr:hypothetical protein [Tannerella sp.]